VIIPTDRDSIAIDFNHSPGSIDYVVVKNPHRFVRFLSKYFGSKNVVALPSTEHRGEGLNRFDQFR
jgi:hypothetical protein